MLSESGKYKNPIVTVIEEVKPFYPAEEQHQEFYQKNPEKYAQEKEERLHYQQSKERN